MNNIDFTVIKSLKYPRKPSKNGWSRLLKLCRLLSGRGIAPCEGLFENDREDRPFFSKLGISIKIAGCRWSHGNLEFLFPFYSRSKSTPDYWCWLCWLIFQFQYSKTSLFDQKYHLQSPTNSFAKDTSPKPLLQLCALSTGIEVFLKLNPRCRLNYHYFLMPNHRNHALIHIFLLDALKTS